MGAKLLIERASWTLVDQCVVSGGNFLLNVLLARTLSQEDYGEFALFLGAIFPLRAFDYSLISYPLSVRLCVASDDGACVAAWKHDAAGRGSEHRLGRGYGDLAPRCWMADEYPAAGVPLLLVLAGAGDVAPMPACRFSLPCGRAGDGTAYVGQALLIALLAWFGTITLPSALYAMSAAFASAPWCMRRSCDLPGRISPNAAIGP